MSSGGVERTAAPGEWRTNVSLGGTHRPAVPTASSCALAVAAARATGADFAGVDLLRVGGEDVVLELNGAVEFDAKYSLPGRDVYDDIAEALALAAVGRAPRAAASEAARVPDAPGFSDRP